MEDDAARPRHYFADTAHEVRDVIQAWGLNFARGSAVKYIARAGRKGDALEDLRKAAECIRYEIASLTRGPHWTDSTETMPPHGPIEYTQPLKGFLRDNPHDPKSEP